jgi:hypothetical protein
MKEENIKLLEKAKNVLENNWKSNYTLPSPFLYPHQWNWDSAFISIGYARFDQDRAQSELLSLFEGQWTNGMLPHIVFRTESDYFPGPEYWQTNLSEFSPAAETSGITQPPAHAISALHIYNHAQNQKQAQEFLKEIYPKILAFHSYLLTKRDPERTGLATIFHPWESGFDNSPRWDDALARIKVEALPRYERTDTKKIDASQRPSKENYDKFIYLIELMKKHHYEERRFYLRFPFKIKDVVFNSILYAANQDLLTIANILGEEDGEIKSWIEKEKENYFRYFCVDREIEGLVYDFDIIARQMIQKRTVAALIPIFTDLLDGDRVQKIFDWMMHSHVCVEQCIHDHKVISSTSLKEEEYNPLNYWRGPIWINMNWMLYKGLQRYGLDEEAERLRLSIIELIDEHGFYEYYHPSSGDGLGTDNFSWTASLLIDLIQP